MQPTNSGNAEGAVGTVADAQVVINGVMSAMTSSSYYGRNLFMYGDAKGGDLTILLPDADWMHSIRSTTLQQQYLFRFLEPWILLHSAGQHLVEQH